MRTEKQDSLRALNLIIPLYFIIALLHLKARALLTAKMPSGGPHLLAAHSLYC